MTRRSVFRTLFLAGLLAGAWVLPAGADEGGAVSPTLEKIRAEGRIYLGFRENHSPFSYLRDGEVVDGYAWKVCLNVVEHLKRRLGLAALQVEPVPTTQNNRLLQVRSRMVDLDCGATVDTLARQRQVGFSRPVFIAGVKVLVSEHASVARLGDLVGKRIAVVADSGMDRVARTSMALRAYDLDLREFPSGEQAMRALILRRADALVMDEIAAALLRSRFAQANGFRLLDDDLALESYALLVNREDAVFKAAVDQALQELWDSGELQRLHQQWFERQIPPDGLQLDLPQRPALGQAYRRGQ